LVGLLAISQNSKELIARFRRLPFSFGNHKTLQGLVAALRLALQSADYRQPASMRLAVLQCDSPCSARECAAVGRCIRLPVEEKMLTEAFSLFVLAQPTIAV
jgi:hypothetical protein